MFEYTHILVILQVGEVEKNTFETFLLWMYTFYLFIFIILIIMFFFLYFFIPEVVLFVREFCFFLGGGGIIVRVHVFKSVS